MGENVFFYSRPRALQVDFIHRHMLRGGETMKYVGAIIHGLPLCTRRTSVNHTILPYSTTLMRDSSLGASLWCVPQYMLIFLAFILQYWVRNLQ